MNCASIKKKHCTMIMHVDSCIAFNSECMQICGLFLLLGFMVSNLQNVQNLVATPTASSNKDHFEA